MDLTVGREKGKKMTSHLMTKIFHGSGTFLKQRVFLWQAYRHIYAELVLLYQVKISESLTRGFFPAIPKTT